MSNSSVELVGSLGSDQLDQKTKDIFNGKALIDRLLVYFSKFEGSREKAKRYAQKLLDLGHIESLSQTLTFEDTQQEYRWTDVAIVINKAKAKAAESQEIGDSTSTRTLSQSSDTESKSSSGYRSRRPTVRISIEADNCEGTEIHANIRTNPTIQHGITSSSTAKTGGTICLTEVKNGKMISFVTETSKTEEILRLVPVSDLSRGEETSFRSTVDSNKIRHSIERKNNTANFHKEIEKKERNSSEGDSAIETDNSSARESSSPIVNSKTSGQGDKTSKVTTKDVKRSPSVDSSKAHTESMPDDVTKAKHRYKWDATKSSQSRNENRGKNEITDHQKNSLSQSSGRIDNGRHSVSSVSSLSESEQSFSTSPTIQRKSKFKDDHDWIKIRREYLENEELREATQKHETVEVFDNMEMTLHSSSNNDNDDFSNTVQQTSTPGNSAKKKENETTDKDTTANLLAPPVQPTITISPPPSPTSPKQANDPSIKSLFWTKIVCNSVTFEEPDSTFWNNVENKICFDEDEFAKLFSKPAVSPVQKNSRSRIHQHQSEDGKTLKALATERSRQIGIRASSIRLPVEDIHDAIVNMDDSILDLDAVEALYDVRPTPDELDDIADVLKRYPNGILDKPEQFVLMLAMIGNLDERLKTWIFARKFPDKVLDIKEQLNALSTACIQIVRNSTLQTLLESVLLIGNFMNKGTQRGEADGYSFDILPKLKDVKSKGGDTNLLLYLVRLVSTKQATSDSTADIVERQNSFNTTEDEPTDCKLPRRAILQKASAVSLPEVLEEIEYLAAELNECKDQILPAVIEGATCIAEIKPFNDMMTTFISQAEKALVEIQAFYTETVDITEEFKHYYVPVEAKTEALGGMLKNINTFCGDFRAYWDEDKRNSAKEAYFNTEKARRQRLAAIKIAKSPSSLKVRFLEKRRRERMYNGESTKEVEQRPSQRNDTQVNGSERITIHSRSKTENKRQETPSRRAMKWKESSSDSRTSEAATPTTHSTSAQHLPLSKARRDFGQSAQRAEQASTTGDEKLKNNPSHKNYHEPMSKLKHAMLKRRQLLKSKTC